MTTGQPTEDVRLFADNGRWWLLSLCDQRIQRVTVHRHHADRTTAPVAELTVATLATGEQIACDPPPIDIAAPGDGVTLEVRWTEHDGQHRTLQYVLPIDGIRRTPAPDDRR